MIRGGRPDSVGANLTLGTKQNKNDNLHTSGAATGENPTQPTSLSTGPPSLTTVHGREDMMPI